MDDAVTKEEIVSNTHTTSTSPPGSIKAGIIEDVAKADLALGYIREHEAAVYTPEQEKAVLRKIDRVLMPLMVVSYMIQYVFPTHPSYFFHHLTP